MGARCCSRGFSVSSTTQVDAPFEIVWETATDIEKTPEYIGYVQSAVRQRDDDNDETTKQFQEGTCWREVREFDGRLYETIIKVTCIDTETDENGLVISKAIHLNVAFTKANSTRFGRVVHTNTLSIYPIRDKLGESCRLILTMAWIWPGFFEQLGLLFCRRRIVSMVEMHLQKELADTKKEAEKRYHATCLSKR